MTDNNNSNTELPTLFQQYIAASKYSRWLDEEQRREIWPEPARRYVENVVRPVLTEAGVKKKEVEVLRSSGLACWATSQSLRLR